MVAGSSRTFSLIFSVLVSFVVEASSTQSAYFPLPLARAAAEYDRAQCAGDRPALERLLADDYVLVNGTAETENKEQLISDFTDPKFKLNPFVVENPQHILWQDGATLSGEVHLTGSSEGHSFQAHIRYVDVWRLRNGRWQVVFTQVTRYPAKA
jgi:ketosteroid isomerase-like protein